MGNNIAVFLSSHCLECDTFFYQSTHFGATFNDNVNPGTVYQKQESLFDKLDYYGNQYTYKKNLAMFDFD